MTFIKRQILTCSTTLLEQYRANLTIMRQIRPRWRVRVWNLDAVQLADLSTCPLQFSACSISPVISTSSLKFLLSNHHLTLFKSQLSPALCLFKNLQYGKVQRSWACQGSQPQFAVRSRLSYMEAETLTADVLDVILMNPAKPIHTSELSSCTHTDTLISYDLYHTVYSAAPTNGN